METHSPHVLTAILAQHIQRNHGMSETEAWGSASDLLKQHGTTSTLQSILANQIEKSAQAGQ
jgi:hypothetical protein